MNYLVKKSIALCLLVALTLTPISAFAQTTKTTIKEIPVKNATATQTYKTPYGNIEIGPNGAVTWTYKAVKAALRTGGWALSKLVELFSPKTGNWIRNNTKALADLMDKTYNWTEGKLTKAINKLGAPDDVASDIAKFIMTLL